MKEFWIYTVLRLGLFVASVATVAGVWMLVSDEVPVVWVLVVGFVISGIASYTLLNRQREAFARRVEERAGRAADAFEARRSREDAD